MDLKSTAKAKLERAGSAFDLVAKKTSGSLAHLKKGLEPIQRYTKVYQAQNVGSVHLKLRQLSTILPDFMQTKGARQQVDATSKFAGKYLGCTLALFTYTVAKHTVALDFVKDFAASHLLGFSNAPLPKVVTGFLASPAAMSYTPAIAASLMVVAAFGAFRLYTGYSAYKDNSFKERREALEGEIEEICIEQGFGPSPKLDKLLKSYEKAFKPDFSPQQTQAIRDSLAAQRSELGIYNSVAPSQQESINKIRDTLTKKYAVPGYLALNVGLNILVEMDGNTHAVMARLKSHNIEEDWIHRFSMNPDATVAGMTRKIERQTDPALNA